MLKALSVQLIFCQRHSPEIQEHRIWREAQSPLDFARSCPEQALITGDVTFWTPGGHTQDPVVLMHYRSAHGHLMTRVQARAQMTAPFRKLHLGVRCESLKFESEICGGTYYECNERLWRNV
jgi:hypothetical protein